MNDIIKILHLEDNDYDAELISFILKKNKIQADITVVQKESDFIHLVETHTFDLIFSDFSLPSYDGKSALEISKEKAPSTPFIFISGTIGEDVAIDSMLNGATDYVLKGNLNRLIPAIHRAIRERNERLERIKAQKALMESEERYRHIYEAATIGIFRMDNNGNFLMANPACVKMLGYNDNEKILGTNLFDMLYDVKELELIKYQLKIQDTLANHETVLIRKDGKAINVYINSHVQVDQSSQKRFYDAVIEDITDRKTAEKAIIAAKEAAERSDRLKSEFLAQMSHEIRTPINVILNFSSLMIEELGREEGDEEFRIIKSAGNRIIRTIDMILNMSELHTGNYNPIFRRIDLIKDVLAKIMLEQMHIASDKGIEFNLNLPDEDLLINGDEYSVYQILMNLIENAIKYTYKGKVEISAKRYDNTISVSIADTGIGIAEEYLPNIFDPFSQEQQGYTRKYEGNGLGLALVKKYCEINNSDISVTSQKDVGSTFTVVFKTASENSNESK